MSTIGWFLFAACLVAAGCLGGTIRGWYDDVQADRERESAQRSAEGAPINEEQT